MDGADAKKQVAETLFPMFAIYKSKLAKNKRMAQGEAKSASLEKLSDELVE